MDVYLNKYYRCKIDKDVLKELSKKSDLKRTNYLNWNKLTIMDVDGLISYRKDWILKI